MVMDPRLDRLVDLIVEDLVRELEIETPSIRGKDSDGVREDNEDDTEAADASLPRITW